MSTTIVNVGPESNGTAMTLEDFESAVGREGYVYELGRGVVVVNQIPQPGHLFQVNSIRRQLGVYEADHADEILCLATGSDCKILLEDLQSERHPDLAIYKTPPPQSQDVWANWIPDIVIEVVSESSAKRDYEEKPDEYLQFGIREYWIVDAEKRAVTALRRSRGNWETEVVTPPARYRTQLLPDFELDVAAVFDAIVE